MTIPDTQPASLARKDIRAAAVKLSAMEARFLVDYYYIAQEDRKRSGSQERAMKDEPNAMLGYLHRQSADIESMIKKALDDYTKEHIMGSWMREVYGIGPVLSAGLLAHIDITQAPTVGHIWRYAGLDPTITWEKGKKRPFNPSLKTLCWKIGQSFMKFSGQEECVYGAFYRQRKAFEIARNERGDNKEVAAAVAAKVGKKTEAYKHAIDGKLPPGQIDARARRWAVKLFLSHMHGEWYEREFKTKPPLPYPIAHLNHTHIIAA